MNGHASKLALISFVGMLLLIGAGCISQIEDLPEKSETATEPVNQADDSSQKEAKKNPALVSNLTEEQSKATTICTNFGGTDELVLSEESGEKEILCRFNDGECYQKELNAFDCYKQKSIDKQNQATTACKNLGGQPSEKLNEENGMKEIFCSFGSSGECMQNELIQKTCFVQKT